jgi:soluble lytic murein transglycosylase-like protein
MPRTVRIVALAAALALIPSAAHAAVPHTVQTGETLWSIAAGQNFTTRALAAYNGLSETSNVVLGSTIQLPSVGEAAGAMQAAGITPAPQPAAQPAAAPAPAAPAAAAPAGGAPPPLGGYKVRPGDTLSGLAAQVGLPAAQIAAVNGLDPQGFLIEGTVVKLPTGAPAPANASQPAPAQTVVPAAAPAATPGRVTSGDIHTIANAAGVPGSLASAIAWQESGFNNAMVSSANARGVMQVMPGTWDWVQQNLASRRLDPANPQDNVHAGVLYLGRLLRETGGDPSLAAAGYYQGLASVRRIGMLPETQRYVANVMALRGRFGG